MNCGAAHHQPICLRYRNDAPSPIRATIIHLSGITRRWSERTTTMTGGKIVCRKSPEKMCAAVTNAAFVSRGRHLMTSWWKELPGFTMKLRYDKADGSGITEKIKKRLGAIIQVIWTEAILSRPITGRN